MKICVRLLIPLLLLALAPVVGRAQEISFTGNEIIKLAGAITTEARRTGQLPSAYQVTMANGHIMIITAPNAFELLCRSIIIWKEKKDYFPAVVPLMLHDLSGPTLDPQFEPKGRSLEIAVLSSDVARYTPAWLALAQQVGHTLSKSMRFETNYTLTAAQFCVAMAMLIDQTAKTGKYPETVVIPLVHSPEQWQDTRTPVMVSKEAVVPSAPVVPVTPQRADMRITLNGIELSEQGPVQPDGRRGMPPFCGMLRIVLTGTGPIATIRLLLDSHDVRIYSGLGPHTHDINTLMLADGMHYISATAFDADGRSSLYVYSFKVMNGRINSFTPAEPVLE